MSWGELVLQFEDVGVQLGNQWPDSSTVRLAGMQGTWSRGKRVEVNASL